MANFFSATEEEQQEILISIWDKYKYGFIGLLILVVASIVSRDYLTDTRNTKNYESAVLFERYLESEEGGSLSGQALLDAYPESLYSDLVRFNEVKVSVAEGNNQKAKDILKTIINRRVDSPEFNPIVNAAQTRLSKIYLSNAEYQETLNLFNGQENLTATLLELKGDAENGLEMFDLAKISYMQAMQSTPSQTTKALLAMKISDLPGVEIE